MEQHIKNDPAVVLGKPVVSGSRITVEHILERLGAGDTVGEGVAEESRGIAADEVLERRRVGAARRR